MKRKTDIHLVSQSSICYWTFHFGYDSKCDICRAKSNCFVKFILNVTSTQNTRMFHYCNGHLFDVCIKDRLLCLLSLQNQYDNVSDITSHILCNLRKVLFDPMAYYKMIAISSFEIQKKGDVRTIKYTCPFCFTKTKKNGEPYKNAKPREHTTNLNQDLHIFNVRNAGYCPLAYNRYSHITFQK